MTTATETNAMRHIYWTAICSFPGLKRFFVGSVVLPFDARQDEVMSALHSLWSEMLPIPVPDNFTPVRGLVLFIAEGEE